MASLFANSVYEVVRPIPSGRAASYGAVGACLEPPVSGYFVGRALANCPLDVPWWRVVAKDGHLPVHKRDPAVARDQRNRLAAEGCPLSESGVAAEHLMTADELLITQP